MIPNRPPVSDSGHTRGCPLISSIATHPQSVKNQTLSLMIGFPTEDTATRDPPSNPMNARNIPGWLRPRRLTVHVTRPPSSQGTPGTAYTTPRCSSTTRCVPGCTGMNWPTPLAGLVEVVHGHAAALARRTWPESCRSWSRPPSCSSASSRATTGEIILGRAQTAAHDHRIRPFQRLRLSVSTMRPRLSPPWSGNAS